MTSRGRSALALGGRVPDRSQAAGQVLMELGVSLSVAAYYPSDDGTGLAIRKYLQEGPLNWVRRRLKNAFTILNVSGVGGSGSASGLMRINQVLNAATKPDWCFVQTIGDAGSATSFTDMPTVFATFVTNMTRTVEILKANGIKPIFAVPPLPADIAGISYKYVGHLKIRAWMQDYAKKNAIPLLNEATPMARPAKQKVLTVTAMSRTSNVVTATATGAATEGWATGDWVTQGDAAVDAGFVFNAATPPSSVQITITSGDSFTYAHTGSNGSATLKGTLVRSESITDLTQDGTHPSAKGASKIALVWESVLEPLFPQVDDLSDTEGDLFNLVATGVGAANTADYIPNRGMMVGTAGTRSGTAVSHTGNVATLWTSSVASGNPTSVTCAKVPRAEPGYTHQEWQEIAIVAAAGADCVHGFYIAHTLPGTWAASASVGAIGGFLKPTTQNGYFYVSLTTGTTGGTEPTWPTIPGQTVVDNTVTWACRQGYKTADKVVLMAEYRIHAMSDVDAIKLLCFQLQDNSDHTQSISDFDADSTPTVAPLYQIGENGYFLTPEATITTAANTQLLAFTVVVAAGKSATLRYTRATWRNLSR